MEISPKYLMGLIDQIEVKIWEEFSSYKKVNHYIEKWHCSDFDYENFAIYCQNEGNVIDLGKTLHGIDSEILIKIAIDLGIETPDFIPSVPLFKNNLKNDYQRALDSFNEATKNVVEQPNISVGLANSTLESIIKYILEDKSIKIKWKENETLYKQTQNILREFQMFPDSNIAEEIRNIGSGLLKVSNNIEKLRSGKTFMHGKTDNGYMIEDSLYACFIVNSVTTVGLFLMSYYDKKYKTRVLEINSEDDLEIKIEDIPF